MGDRWMRRVCVALVWLASIGAPCVAWAQSQTQVQYQYDAAGNLTQITRSTVTPAPDLTVSNLSVGTITVNTNGSFYVPVSFQVNNVGTLAASATWYDRGYLSTNSTLHDTDLNRPGIPGGSIL
jgi:hypothetical protein